MSVSRLSWRACRAVLSRGAVQHAQNSTSRQRVVSYRNDTGHVEFELSKPWKHAYKIRKNFPSLYVFWLRFIIHTLCYANISCHACRDWWHQISNENLRYSSTCIALKRDILLALLAVLIWFTDYSVWSLLFGPPCSENVKNKQTGLSAITACSTNVIIKNITWSSADQSGRRWQARCGWRHHPGPSTS